MVRIKYNVQFRSMQTSELLINFRDSEEFFELLGIIYTKLVVYHCQLTGLKKHGGSGRVRELGPDPTRPARVWTRPDPPFLSIFRPDPTQPNPTRPAGRPDPGTTLVQIGEVSSIAYFNP